ncbi:hypothetical protein IC620_05210 [Hazenella sp. IB182357]|uniref:Uncharacterized protein n=1 Tax=Polycladospora coralii TaxID=2771432 RepID=A0A926N688_9BACL|nr:hypothetical protein [Polycladospora coralii]MBD1371756.1 hypothetical protein [Polycladospora coralii]
MALVDVAHFGGGKILIIDTKLNHLILNIPDEDRPFRPFFHPMDNIGMF